MTLEDDSIYYDRFIRLPAQELVKINFPKHILGLTDSKFSLKSKNKDSGSEEAFELLSILISEHRNIDDEIEPIDLPLLLHDDKMCRDKFEAWLQKTNSEHVNEIVI